MGSNTTYIEKEILFTKPTHNEQCILHYRNNQRKLPKNGTYRKKLLFNVQF